MEYKHIDQLLEKYWAGESSLEEEDQLKDYFQNGSVAGRHQNWAPLFQHFRKAQDEKLAQDFDRRLIDRLEAQSTVTERRPQTKPRVLYRNLVRAAAVFVLALSLWWFLRPPEQSSKLAQLDKTEIEEAKRAYQQTKAALLLISQKMNKGTDTALQGIGQLDEATKKVKNN